MILLIPNVSMLRQWNWWVIVTVTLVRLWGSLGLGPALYPFAAVVRKTTARVQAGYDGGMPVRFVASLLTLAGGDGPSQTTGKMPPDPKRRCVASAPCPPIRVGPPEDGGFARGWQESNPLIGQGMPRSSPNLFARE